MNDWEELREDDWLDTILRKCQAETVKNYIACKEDGSTVAEALLIPTWDERRTTAHDAILSKIAADRKATLERLKASVPKKVELSENMTGETKTFVSGQNRIIEQFTQLIERELWLEIQQAHIDNTEQS